MRVGICDDNKQITEEIIELIKQYPDYSPALEFLTFQDADSLMDCSEKLDLLYLDIELPNMKGTELVPVIRKKHPGITIIFISSHSKYSIHSHRLNVFQFLHKPFDPVVFWEEFNRFLNNYFREHKMYTISNRHNKKEIPLADIVLIQSNLRKLLIYCNDGVIYTMMGNLSKETQRLNPFGFIRCHQSNLVNLKYIKDFKNGLIYTDAIFDSHPLEIAVSKKYTVATRSAYHAYLSGVELK